LARSYRTPISEGNDRHCDPPRQDKATLVRHDDGSRDRRGRVAGAELLKRAAASRLDGGWNNIYFEQADDHAVGSVSWNDAQAFCAFLSDKLGLPIVLPTEAQWEKAARGTEGRRFPWGNEVPDGRRANYADLNFIGKYG
jgi:formylglycine-generating enzyme required for sulfatase activity